MRYKRSGRSRHSRRRSRSRSISRELVRGGGYDDRSMSFGGFGLEECYESPEPDIEVLTSEVCEYIYIVLFLQQ